MTTPTPFTRPFTWLMRVRYAECDAQKVVFNARYGEYADVAMTEYFRALFGSYEALLAQGLDCQVVRQATDFRAPARFDDVLAVAVATASVGNTSFVLEMNLHNHATQQLLATTTTTYVMVTAQNHQKTPVPQALRTSLLAGKPGVVVNMAGVDLG